MVIFIDSIFCCIACHIQWYRQGETRNRKYRGRRRNEEEGREEEEEEKEGENEEEKRGDEISGRKDGYGVDEEGRQSGDGRYQVGSGQGDVFEWNF